MGKRCFLFLVMVVAANLDFSYAAAKKAKTAGGTPAPSAGKKQAKSVSGNTSPSHFPITQDYCDSRSAYNYSASAVPAPVEAGRTADIPTKAIPHLREFTDDGSNILTNTSSAFPLADGSDSSRLLVRALSAGTCGVRVSIAPASISLPARQGIRFIPVWMTGRELSQFDKELIWSINQDDDKGTYGRIKDGYYTAPLNIPDTKTITVSATSKSNSAFSASAQVTVTSAGLAAPSMIPSQVSVREGDTIQFTLLSVTGPVQTLDPIPTDGGRGYTQEDVGKPLTISTGDGTATVLITQVNNGSGSGPVTQIATTPTKEGGNSYYVGIGQATTGGHGTGCTVQISAVEPTGPVQTLNATPTDGGTGYTQEDVGKPLTISMGDGTATVLITQVNNGSGSGPVTQIATTPTAGGNSYSAGARQATTGGHGTGCTVLITQISGHFTSDAPPMPKFNATPTEGGKGYTQDDVGNSLTVMTGDGKATVAIAEVNDKGAVARIHTYPTAPGHNYSVGRGQATTGGHGTGCTVEITAFEPAIDATTGLFKAPLLTPDDSGKKTPMKVIVTATVSRGNATPPEAVTATVTVTPSFNLLDAKYYVINIVRWKRQASSYQANSNEWYIFNTSDKSVVHQSPFGSFHPKVAKASDTRIFGSKKVAFLAVHLRSDDISQQDFKSLHINYNVSATQIQPMNIQDVQALLQLIGIGAAAAAPTVKAGPAPPPPPTPVGLYGGGPLTNGLESLPAKVTFEADVSFPSSASATKNAAPPAAAPSPAPTDQTAAKSTTPPTCDSTPSSSSKAQASCTLTQSVTNEGLHHWDVSAGVPFNALNQYSFASTDGTVTEKSNAKLNAYGFFDLYPFHGADLAGPPWSSYPHLMIGLPFSGKVFDRPFVGVGFLHLKQLPVLGKLIPLQANLYAGWLIEKEFKPKTLTVGSHATAGALANDLKPERDFKPQFGIEFSIRSLKKAATGSTTKQSTSSTKPQ
jgi:hypothetical protein